MDKRVALFIIYLIYFIYYDVNQIGTLSGYFDAEYGIVMTFYNLFILSSIVLTATFFFLRSLKSENKELKLKGKFLILGFVLYLICGFYDVGIIPLSPLALIIARIFLITSSIFIYIGFFLPKTIKRIFIKE